MKREDVKIGMMDEINERQLEILRHALNWPLYNRNYYISCRECDSFNDCEQLVGAGLMERMRSESLLFPGYKATKLGKDFVMRKS